MHGIGFLPVLITFVQIQYGKSHLQQQNESFFRCIESPHRGLFQGTQHQAYRKHPTLPQVRDPVGLYHHPLHLPGIRADTGLVVNCILRSDGFELRQYRIQHHARRRSWLLLPEQDGEYADVLVAQPDGGIQFHVEGEA